MEDMKDMEDLKRLREKSSLRESKEFKIQCRGLKKLPTF